jgi:hypothetical protein
MKASKLFDLVTMQWQRFGECEVVIDGGDYSLPIADVLIIDSKLVIKTEPATINKIISDYEQRIADLAKEYDALVIANKELNRVVGLYESDNAKYEKYLKAKNAECENLLTEVDAHRVTIAMLADKVKEYEKK